MSKVLFSVDVVDAAGFQAGWLPLGISGYCNSGIVEHILHYFTASERVSSQKGRVCHHGEDGCAHPTRHRICLSSVEVYSVGVVRCNLTGVATCHCTLGIGALAMYRHSQKLCFSTSFLRLTISSCRAWTRDVWMCIFSSSRLHRC